MTIYSKIKEKIKEISQKGDNEHIYLSAIEIELLSFGWALESNMPDLQRTVLNGNEIRTYLGVEILKKNEY